MSVRLWNNRIEFLSLFKKCHAGDDAGGDLSERMPRATNGNICPQITPSPVNELSLMSNVQGLSSLRIRVLESGLVIRSPG